MLNRRSFLIAGTAGLALAAAAPAAAQSLTKIRILMPVTQIDEAYAPYMIAQEAGYFKQEGLDVSLVPVAGAKQALIQLATGNAEASVVSPVDLMIGQQPPHNMNVQLFYNNYYRCIWSINVMPDSPIKSVEQLKGKKLGVSSMGSSGVTFGKAFLASAGLQIPRDAQFLPIGVGGQGAAALRSKAVDAVVYWDAMVTKMELAGLNMRPLPVDPVIQNMPDIGVGARTDYIEENPKVIAGIGRALAKGYVFNQANPAAAVHITWKRYPEAKPANVPEDKALQRAVAVNQSRMKIWTTPEVKGRFGIFFEEGFRTVESFAKEYAKLDKAAKVDLNKVFTNRFVPEFSKFEKKAVEADARAWKM